MLPFTRTVLVVASLVLLPAISAEARDKTDIIYLANGDRITGEIKELDRGKLQVKTDSMGTIYMEWEDIASVESNYQFQFERSDGTRVTGKIQPTSEESSITLLAGLGRVTFAHERVVRISQIEDSFWDQLKGSLSFGYSFTKASDVAQANAGFSVSHRTRERAYTLDGSTIITRDQNNKQTDRSTLNSGLTRFHANRWFNNFTFGFESNDELGLDLRTSFGAGIGRYLVQTNRTELSLVGGLLATAENLDPVDTGGGATTGQSSTENLEAQFGIAFDRFIFDSPSMDLSTSLYVYPNLTESNRTRSQLDISLRWELIKDLYWDLSYYNSYDSKPPSGSESTSDYGIVTSVSWSF